MLAMSGINTTTYYGFRHMFPEDLSRAQVRADETEMQFCSVIDRYEAEHGYPPRKDDIRALFPGKGGEWVSDRLFLLTAKGLVRPGADGAGAYMLTALGRMFLNN